MKRHLVRAGTGIATAGLALIVGYLIATVTSSLHHLPHWPYFLGGGMVIVGILLYFVGQESGRERPDSEDAIRHSRSPNQPSARNRLSSPMATVLENRLNILDKLESLVETNPRLRSYEISLDSFSLTGDAKSAQAQFSYLQSEGVARFIFPQGITQWNFWDTVIRIRDIDPESVRGLQNRTRSQLRAD